MNTLVENYYFEPGTLIAFDGFQVVVTGAVANGIAVRDRYVGREDGARHFVIDNEKVCELLNRLDVVVDSDFTIDEQHQNQDASEEKSFDFRDEKQRQKAFQKEVWVLATKSILKAPPYTEARINRAYKEIQAEAFDRQRLSQLGLSKTESSRRNLGAQNQ